MSQENSVILLKSFLVSVFVLCFFDINAQRYFPCDSIIMEDSEKFIITSDCKTYFAPEGHQYRDLTLDLGQSLESLYTEMIVFKNIDYCEYRVYLNMEGKKTILIMAELNSERQLNGIYFSFDTFGRIIFRASYKNGSKDGNMFIYSLEDETPKKYFDINYIRRFKRGKLIKSVKVSEDL